ncbi:MAG: hypothetical protein ABFD52_04875 [Acidobacteriota bacterium]
MASGFDLGSILGHIGLDKTEWNQGISSVQKDVKELGTQAAKLGREFADIGKKLALVGAAAAAGIAAAVKMTANAGDEINDMSQRTGIATEILSSFKLAAEKSGASIDGLAIGLRGLASNMQTAAAGGKAQADMFKSLGVDIVDSTGKLRPLNDVLFGVADRFSALEDGAMKTALAQDVFGRSGMELIPLLNLGSKGLEEEAAAAARLGLVFSKDSAKACDMFNDSLAELKGAFAGIRNDIALALIPATRSLVSGMTDGLAVLRSKIAEFAAS